MNTLNRIKEILYISATKVGDIFQNRAIAGSKYNFFAFQVSNAAEYALSIFSGRIHLLKKFLDWRKSRRKYEEFIIENNTGKFVVNTKNDAIVMSSHYYDPFQKDWLISERKNTFLDIGANIGHYTLLAKKTGFKKVVCFEPDPDTFKILERNIELNKLKNIQVFNCGAGNSNSTLPFRKDNHNTGGNSFYIEKKSKNIAKISVVKLDNFLPQHKINSSKIDFIKIDVEGFEFEVLKGMKNILKALQPGTILMIEIWDRSPKRKETLKFIEDKNFVLVKTYDDNYLFRKNSKPHLNQ